MELTAENWLREFEKSNTSSSANEAQRRAFEGTQVKVLKEALLKITGVETNFFEKFSFASETGLRVSDYVISKYGVELNRVMTYKNFLGSIQTLEERRLLENK